MSYQYYYVASLGASSTQAINTLYANGGFPWYYYSRALLMHLFRVLSLGSVTQLPTPAYWHC